MATEYDPAFEPATAERIARNDAVFRDANERIRAAAEQQDVDGFPIPFICECADPGCRELVHLSLAEYRWIRDDPRRFLNALGHEEDAGGQAELVAARDGYAVVVKTGEAGRVAGALEDGGGELAAPSGKG